MENRRKGGASRSRRAACRLVAVAFVVGAACSSGAPVDDATRAAAEDELLAPFLVERTIVADRLEIRMTANFFDDLTTRGMAAGIQEETHTPLDDGGARYVYRNLDASAPPLLLTLGKTEFAILQRARVDVLGGTSEFTLEAAASGKVSVKEGSDLHHSNEVRIQHGAFQRK